MEVQWIGTATMEVRNGNDVILIDPYNQPYNKRFKKISEEEMKGVKAIFITHPHLDHFTKIDQFSKQAGYCPIYVNAKGIETAKKHHYRTKEMYEIIVGDEIKVGSLTVRVHQGRHCDLDKKLFFTFAHRLLNPINLYRAAKMGIEQKLTFTIGELDIFCFEITDGEKTVFLMGSSNIYEPATRPEHIDMLVYPFQGLRLDNMFLHSLTIMGFYYADTILFDHWDNAFPPITTTMELDKFLPLAKHHFPQTHFITPCRGEWYKV
ncbi:MAG: MBL fold metallo-hydrolase [Clostridia bacterium]|nr:MBL fold metallo-hydrolase [Candidatus Limimonas egerieequi]MCQ2489104.1 MBL fold metallo-hydrolase [Clostridia bacterium]